METVQTFEYTPAILQMAFIDWSTRIAQDMPNVRFNSQIRHTIADLSARIRNEQMTIAEAENAFLSVVAVQA